MAEQSSRYAWTVCLVASLFCLYEFIQLMMFNAINASLMHAFAIQATKLGQISASYLIANVIFMFPAGIILDRMSTKQLIIGAMMLCISGTLLFSYAHSVTQAMLGRFLTGIGGAFPFLSCLRLASRWILPKQLALATGLMVTIMMLGGITGQAPMVFLVKFLGWRLALRWDAVLGVLFVVAIAIVVRDYPPDYRLPLKSAKRSLPHNSLLQTIKMVVCNRQNWLFGLYGCLLNLPLMLLGAIWGSLFLTQIYHFTPINASYVTSMIFFGTILGSPVIGYISDKIGRRKWPMIVCAILAMIIILTLMYLSRVSLPMMFLLFFLLGFITSAQIIVYPAITESNHHDHVGAALGLASVLIMGGAALGQPLFGWFMDRHWAGDMVNGIAHYTLASYHHGFMIFPVAIIIGLIAVLLAKETYCKIMGGK